MGFEEVEFGSSRGVASAPTESEPPRTVIPAPKRDGVLVPLDQWSLLNQLGNLHQAGQQLAEARERAAKAETEARFFSERLKEMRAELAEAKSKSSQTESTPAPLEPIVTPASPSTNRVLVIKIPPRLTRWWIGRRS